MSRWLGAAHWARYLLGGLLLSGLLLGCGVPDELLTPTPTPTPRITATPTTMPTAIILPTNTPVPTSPPSTPQPTSAETNPTATATATRALTPTLQPTSPLPATPGSVPSTGDQGVGSTPASGSTPGISQLVPVVIGGDGPTVVPGVPTVIVGITPATSTPIPPPPPTPTPEPPPPPPPTETPTPEPVYVETAPCDGAIPWYEAINYLGTWQIVYGPVVAAYWAEEARGKPTFLNVGAPYPDPSRFTILMWIPARWNFDVPPEHTYLGSVVCVAGLIELYEGGAEMVIDGPGVIWIP